MIDSHFATSESTAAWESFLNSPYQRGLEGNCGDVGSGLHGALEIMYPKVPYPLLPLTARLPRLTAALPSWRRSFPKAVASASIDTTGSSPDWRRLRLCVQLRPRNLS